MNGDAPTVAPTEPLREGHTQLDRIEAKLDLLLPMIAPLEEFSELVAALKGNPMMRGMMRAKGVKLPRE